MDNISVITVLQSELYDLPIKPGRISICSDYNKDIYYDTTKYERKDISNFVVKFSTYNDMINSGIEFVPSVLYLDISESKFYGIVISQGDAFKEIQYINECEDILAHPDIFEGTLIEDENGNVTTTPTTTEQVFTDRGLTLDESLDESSILTLYRTKIMHAKVTATVGITVLPIPFPKENYDFEGGDKLIVFKNGFPFEEDRYHIVGQYLRINPTETPFQENDEITYIFFYKLRYDLNSAVQLGTQNYADGSITTEKLSPYITLSANSIEESDTRIFFTPELLEKLNGIEEHATHYVQPETFPATMIVETNNRYFLTDAERNKIEASVTLDTVYSKLEVDQLFTDLIGNSPDLLNTLSELSKALNNDTNFAANITAMINERATIAQVDAMQAQLDEKVDKTDYVRNCVTGTVSKTNNTADGSNLYHMNFKEDDTLLAYKDMMLVVMKVSEENTAECYFQMNNLDIVPILNNGEKLLEGELKPGIYSMRYNGTSKNFQLQGKGGGTDLIDTTLNKYLVNKDFTRGKRIDILDDNTIRESRPKLKLRAINNLSDTQYYSNGENVVNYIIDKNRVLLVWKYDSYLRCRVVKLTDNGYSDVDSRVYTEITSACTKFSVVKQEKCYVICYGTISNDIICTPIIIDDVNISIGTQYSFVESTSDIFNMSSFNIDNEKGIIAYQLNDAPNKIRCFYFATYGGTSCRALSNKTNIDFPINQYCQISDSQIVFGNLEGSKVILWVLNITETDIFFCNKVEVYTDPDGDTLSNLGIYRKSDNTILITWSKSSCLFFYKRDIVINEVGGMEFQSDNSDIITMPTTSNDFLTLRVNKQINISDNYYISVSNYDGDIPTNSTLPQACIRVGINEDCDMQTLYEKYCDIFHNSSIYDIDVLNNMVAVSFIDKQKPDDIDHLYLMILDIIKCPDGISVESGISNNYARIKQW